MRKFSIMHVFLLCIVLLFIASCQKKNDKQIETKKLTVVTTLFPLYDFAKNIGGEYVSVSMLLPPGVESHSFEPKPEDIIRINRADIFIYTGKYMEPWAEKILKGTDNKSLIVVDSSKGITLIKEVDDHSHSHVHGHDHAHEMDPHIWLDFENAQKMVDDILGGFITADPNNESVYRKNAENYKSILRELDNKFREGLASCKLRYFIHGGHYAFGYMAKRYGLNYISAYHGFSPDAEPTARRLAELTRKMKKHNAKYVFYEELISPRVAEVIAKETGANLLQLHAAHNLTKEEWDRGVTFKYLMEQNLVNLKTGLQCQ
jgi:zinc transport system substrate-binding protein